MKKILLLFAGVSMAVAANAVCVIDLYQGETLWNEGEHVFSDVKIVDEGNYFEVTIDPDLSIVTDMSGVQATITATSLTSGQVIQMCAGGLCESGESVTKSVSLTANQKLPLQLEYYAQVLEESEIPSEVKVQLDVMDNVTDCGGSHYVIVMKNEQGSVEVIESNDGIYFEGRNLHYSVAKAGKITVYDFNGRAVLATAVNGIGVVDLSGLAKGVYTYVVNAGPRTTGKIIL